MIFFWLRRTLIACLLIALANCGRGPRVVNSNDVEVELWVVPEEDVAIFFDAEKSSPKQPTYQQLRKNNNQYLVARILNHKPNALRGTLVVGENGREVSRIPSISVYLPNDEREVLVAIPLRQGFLDFTATTPHLTFRWAELYWAD